MPYRCATCGQDHEGLPDVGANVPAQWWDVPEDERDGRIKLTSDTCIVDDRDYLIRGVIELPVLDWGEPFGFGVWVSQKRENFLTYVENFQSDRIGPFFGWLCTHIDFYTEETLLLKTRAHFRGGGQRPFIELEPTDHPLAREQRNGISLDRAWAIVHHYLAPGPPAG